VDDRPRSITDKIAMSKRYIGISLVISATIVFTVSQVLVKDLSADMDAFTIVFWRSAVGILTVLFPAFIRRGPRQKPVQWDRKTIYWLLVRGLVGAGGMSLFFWGISLAELGQAGSIVYTNPIFAVLFSWLFLKEKINPITYVSVLIAVAGVFLVYNPFTQALGGEHLFLLGTAVCYGFMYPVIRILKLRGVPSWLIVLSLVTFATLAGLPSAIANPVHFTLPIALKLIGLGVTATLGQLFITQAARYEKPRTISILALLALFELMFAGILFFGELFSWQKLVGAGCVMVASAITILSRGVED
jgi:drug/metabolite transporter (DMT)-like permease